MTKVLLSIGREVEITDERDLVDLRANGYLVPEQPAGDPPTGRRPHALSVDTGTQDGTTREQAGG